MRRFIFLSLCVVLFAPFISLHAQVVPSANGRTLALSAGGLGSIFQPDYAGLEVAQTSPNRLYGAGAYVDARFSRWMQLEGEFRWMRFNQYYWEPSAGNGENVYLVGPRIPIRNFRKVTPYGKVLIGAGNGSFLTGTSFVVDYGGGLDYQLSRHLTVRAVDFEYQQWFVTPTLWPYGGSVGISYKIF